MPEKPRFYKYFRRKTGIKPVFCVKRARFDTNRREFIVLIASMMALSALAVDIILPALSDIRDEFRVPNRNAGQLLIVLYLMAFGICQPFFGPLTDRYGRRALLGAGLGVYALAGFYCVLASDFNGLLTARIVQGIAAGLVRVVAISIVRDVCSGRHMARTMSMVMMVFMLVPIIAPALGQAIMLATDAWRPVFLALGLYALLVAGWIGLRLSETLSPEKRIRLSPRAVSSAYGKVLSTRQTLGYGLANGLVFGILFNFVATSEQIFRDIYHATLSFPLYFGGCGIMMVIANMFNVRVVMRFGMRRLSHSAIILLFVASLSHALVAWLSGGSAPFWVFYPSVLVAFFCVALAGPNFNALAMEKVGDVAGTAAAFSGFTSTFLASCLGWGIGQAYDGRTDMLFAGHALLAFLTLIFIWITERGQLLAPGVSSDAPGQDRLE